MSKMNLNLRIKKYSDFEEAVTQITELYNKMVEIFDSQVANTEKINQTDTWTGAAQQATYEQLSKLNKNYEPITESLRIYITFLNKTKEDYLAEMEAQKANIEAFDDNLTVNS